MYPKHKIEKLIKKYEPEFKKLLGIKSRTKFYVVNSTTKKYQKMRVSNGDNMGLSLIAINGRADIFIFSDKHTTERQVLGTIIHELLHVRINKIVGLITLNSDKINSVEEKFVRDLENFIIASWYDKAI